MRVSLFRNRVWIAFLLIAATYLALDFWRPSDNYVRAIAVVVAAVILAQVIAWIFSLLLAKRIRALNSFTERLLDAPLSSDEILEADDELGILNQSLHRMSNRIRDLVGTLSVESDRRESILASMVEGVLAVDNRLQVIFCNDPLARVLGASPPVEEGTPVLDLVRDPALVNLLTQVIASGESVKHKIQLSSGAGKSFEAQAAPLAMPERRGAIVILHDITDLERLERVRKDFVANVSHELRTPLTAIRGYAETLLAGALADTENNRRFVEIIQSHAIRLNNIAADLMVLSELESGRPAAEPEIVSVRDAVDMAMGTLESEARVRGVTLVGPESSDFYVLGHKIRLEQALVNLLDNAVKFNRPNGEARIDTDLTTDRKVRIVVSDTGSGIPSDDLPRIFERFYRVDRARSRAVGGTGLGLSIVKHVVERMNGTIRVGSQLGRGSAFTILIPASGGFEDSDALGAAYDDHSSHPQKHAVLHDADGVV
jgi:two-component system phosphate regulon sensor histidine kinase PhoR